LKELLHEPVPGVVQAIEDADLVVEVERKQRLAWALTQLVEFVDP
jgi:hypothetical protein